MKTKKIAVVGATGNVGRVMLSILSERGVPVGNITALASSKSLNKQVSYGEDDIITIKSLENFDFKGTDIVLMSVEDHVAEKYAPIAAKQGAVVIDNSAFFRMDPDVPLVVPEVNADALAGFRKKNIIANPNCSTIQMLMALKPIHEMAGVKRVVAITFQSVSGAGTRGMDELNSQTKGIFVNQEIEPDAFSKPIAFNVIPRIGLFMDDGETKEEWKMHVETRKILDGSIEVSATCVRVPVFIGHAVALHIELNESLRVDQAHRGLSSFPGVMVVDNPEFDDYITPIEAAGEDDVYVSRVRIDKTVPYGLAMWVVADNVRKGAALNAIQIAETLISKNLI